MLNDALPQVTFEIGAWAVGLREKKAIPVHREYKVFKVSADPRETVVSRVSKATLVLKEILVSAVLKDLRGTLVLSVRKETEALLD